MDRERRKLLYILDPGGRFVFLGENVFGLLGYSTDELIGRHYSSIICPEDTGKARRRFDERRTGERSTRGHKLHLMRKGSRRKGTRSRAERGRLEVEVHAQGMWSKSVSSGRKRFHGTCGVVGELSGDTVCEGRAGPLRDGVFEFLIDLLESEREGFARELDDYACQVLSSLKMDLESIEQSGEIPPGSLGRLRSARKKTVTLINRLRGIAREIRPSSLNLMGLVPSLDAYLKDFEEKSGIRTHFFTSGIVERYPRERELALFRIVEDALRTAIHIARAGEVFVSLVRQGKYLSLSVEDDGIGFDPEELRCPENEAGLRLLLMERRTIHLGGRFRVESGKGRGTFLLAEIPLK